MTQKIFEIRTRFKGDLSPWEEIEAYLMPAGTLEEVISIITAATSVGVALNLPIREIRINERGGAQGYYVQPIAAAPVYIIQEIARDEQTGEYIPCLVVPGEHGYHKTDWRWGTDYEIAWELANDRNTLLGYIPEQVAKIVLDNMFG
jgi:hypothetical protein